MKLFDDKTRWQHFGWAIPIGALLTILCVLGVASALEARPTGVTGSAPCLEAWWAKVFNF